MRVDDPGVFYDAVLRNNSAILAIYGVPNQDVRWYTSELEKPNFFPGVLHYTRSPEVLTFDKKWSHRNREYWSAIGSVIKGLIRMNEFNVPYVISEVKKNSKNLQRRYGLTRDKVGVDFFSE